MMAVIIFIALASLSDGACPAGTRMLPIDLSTKPVCKVQVPCHPEAARRGPLRREKAPGTERSAQNWGIRFGRATKRGTEPPITQESHRWSYPGSKNCYAA